MLLRKRKKQKNTQPDPTLFHIDSNVGRLAISHLEIVSKCTDTSTGVATISFANLEKFSFPLIVSLGCLLPGMNALIEKNEEIKIVNSKPHVNVLLLV